jgi:hypothetical protein
MTEMPHVMPTMQAPQCVKVMTYSGWNPPPGNRRMHGDLLYIHVVTLEDKKYHVTASTHGFFINQLVFAQMISSYCTKMNVASCLLCLHKRCVDTCLVSHNMPSPVL